MNVTLEDARPFLARMPRTLRAMVEGLPDRWLDVNEGPETFTVRDVVGHLISGEETDWIPRMKRLLEHGESQPFDRFDRTAFRARYGTMPIGDLLERFDAARAQSLRDLDALALAPADFARAGTHPEFGRVTLGQLLATWVAHDFTHVTQIARVTARQYGEAVGPWRKYLRVVRE